MTNDEQDIQFLKDTNEQVKAVLKNVSGPDGRFNLVFDGEKETGWLFFYSATMPDFKLRVAKHG